MTDALDLDALGLIVREYPWPLPECLPPRYPLWEVCDPIGGAPVAFGFSRDDAIANAQARLRQHADRRGLSPAALLAVLRFGASTQPEEHPA